MVLDAVTTLRGEMIFFKDRYHTFAHNTHILHNAYVCVANYNVRGLLMYRVAVLLCLQLLLA